MPLFPAHETTLCYLADSLGTSSEPGADTAHGFWEGIQSAAAESGMHLLAMINEPVGKDVCRLFRLVRPDLASLYVSWIRRNDDAMEAVLAVASRRYHVCLSLAHPQAQRVLIANNKGFEDLFRHLLDRHGYRRIAMIRGPEAEHSAARDRFNTYRQMLAANGIGFDPKLCSDCGPWSVEQGYTGVAQLLDVQGLQPGRDLDVIVCMDRIAMGAIRALRRRGYHVPDDVAVTGFNNLQDAQSQTPSLTSVSNPFHLQAIHAVRQGLYALGLRTEPCDDALLNSVLAVGESCGCKDPHLHIPYRDEDTNRFAGLSRIEADHLLRRDLTAYFLLLRMALPDVGRMADTLIGAYEQALSRAEPEAFTAAILPHLQTGNYAYMDLVHWQDVLSLFQHKAACEDGAPFQRAEYLIDMARVAVCDHYARGQTAYQLRETRKGLLRRELSQSLTDVPNETVLCRELAAQLPSMGVNNCWLALYESDPELARLHLVLRDGAAHVLPDGEEAVYPAIELIPPALRPVCGRCVLIACPLVHGEVEFGFIIFAAAAVNGDFYRTLANVIASSLRGIQYRRELERRATQLEASLVELYQTQEKLLETARMAALGELVTGLAHELNTPIGIGVTLASTISNESGGLRESIASGGAQRSKVLAVLGTLDDCAGTLLRNLQRASGLVESFKQISIDQTREELREFDLADYLRNIVGSFNERLAAQQVCVNLELGAPCPLRSYPGAFALIVSHLLQNSLQHGFALGQHGTIRIALSQQDQALQLAYADDGAGMDAEVLARMYNPFFTTQRAQGCAGLGMHIVYNQVTQVLGGAISCQSTPGQGTHFNLLLPFIPPAR